MSNTKPDPDRRISATPEALAQAVLKPPKRPK